MRFRNKAVLTAAVYAATIGAASASSGLQAEAQLTPFGNFVVLYVGVFLLAIGLVFAGLRWAFASHIGEAGRTAAQWLIGAALIAGGLTTGTGWILSHFGLSVGAVF